MRIYNPKTKQSIRVDFVDDVNGYRERVYLALCLVEHHDIFGQNAHLHAKYNPRLDTWRLDAWRTTMIAGKVRLEGSASLEEIEKLGWEYTD